MGERIKIFIHKQNRTGTIKTHSSSTTNGKRQK